jgi:hypothetical protein
MMMMVVVVSTFAVTTAHALVLTVSHDLLFRQPPSLRRRCCRRLSLPKVTSQDRRFLPAFAIVIGVHRCEPLAYAPTQSTGFRYSAPPAALPRCSTLILRA